MAGEHVTVLLLQFGVNYTFNIIIYHIIDTFDEKSPIIMQVIKSQMFKQFIGDSVRRVTGSSVHINLAESMQCISEKHS